MKFKGAGKFPAGVDLYPRTKKFSRYPGVRGHIRAINLANLSFREYKTFRNASLDELIEMLHEDSEWMDKHDYYRKEDQRMDSMSRIEEYKVQYADMIKVLERMGA